MLGFLKKENKNVIENVLCDSCGNTFTVKKIESKHVGEYKGFNVIFNFFSCKRCRERFFVGVDCKRFNEMVQEMRKNYQSIKLMNELKNKNEIDSLFEKNKLLEIEIKQLTNELKTYFHDWK